MKRKMPVLCLLAAALVSLALLAGCGAKAQPVYITVVNRTTLPLADLRIKLVSEEDFGENRLETTLQEGETASIQLGRYTQAQLGGGFHEDVVNDFTAFAGIWLGEANNDYDSMEIDADGSWTLYLCGEAVDSGSLRYEPEWEAVYAYSDLDDSGSRIALEGS
ncbi:MAG: hypothetical protein MR600_08275, partial [Subdoligranulum sp.]|nr:hypothetical protein [Subdoligranulum sp.]